MNENDNHGEAENEPRSETAGGSRTPKEDESEPTDDGSIAYGVIAENTEVDRVPTDKADNERCDLDR